MIWFWFQWNEDGAYTLYNGDTILDKKTFKNRYPLSHIDKLLGQSHVIDIFSKVDLILGYRHA